MSRLISVLVALGVGLAGTLALTVAPAQADGSVRVANPDGRAVADPTYATRITVSGRGFQAVKGGAGGVYVVFGTIGSGWRPSVGGKSGRDFFYIPDSQTRNNAGYIRFIAFPGSDSASSANGVMKADGSWSTTLTVPGAVFSAATADGGTKTIDCTKASCGVITFGAHALTNSHNETFTRVTFADLYADDSNGPDNSGGSDGSDASGSPGTVAPTAAATGDTSGAGAGGQNAGTGGVVPVRIKGPARIEVDRDSATAGHVMAFTASGITPGRQVSVLLDDGAAGAGPFVAANDGRLAGVITLPADAAGGTHELRLVGADRSTSVNFAIAADPDATAPSGAEPVAATTNEPVDLGILFFALAALVFVAVAGLLWLGRRR